MPKSLLSADTVAVIEDAYATTGQTIESIRSLRSCTTLATST